MPTTTVLVIDDRANWRDLLENLLARGENRHAILTAKDPKEAIDLIEQHNFGLVVTNLGLEPNRGSYDRSGLQIVDRLQQRAPGTPCIILTAFDDLIREQVENYCLRYNAHIKVVWKWGPTVHSDLRKAVAYLLHQNL